MQIVLTNLDGSEIARAPITTDAHGYLYVDHPTFQFEMDCALYGYQEGRVSHDSIVDDNDAPYVLWRVEV